MADPRPSSPANWRFDPFTEAYSAVTITDEDRQIPGSSPYQVRLYEVPREDDPSSVDCVILVELDEDLTIEEPSVDVLAAHYDRVQVGDVLLCDEEQMLVVLTPGSPTLAVTRGYGGTDPATHTDGTIMEILDSMTEIVSGSPATREFRVDYKYNTGLVLCNNAEAGYDVRFDYKGLGRPFSDLWILGADRILGPNDINWATSGQSGSIPATSSVDISLNEYSIFPSIVGDALGRYLRLTPIDDVGGAADPATPEFRIQNNDEANARPYDVDWRYFAASAGPKMWVIFDQDGIPQHIWHMESAPHVKWFPEKFLRNVPNGGECREIEVTRNLLKSMKEKRGKNRGLIKVLNEDFEIQASENAKYRLKQKE